MLLAKAEEIASAYDKNETELFILRAAAWFHDTRHLFGPTDGHENLSVCIMSGYLPTIGVEKNISAKIGQCILATKNI